MTKLSLLTKIGIVLSLPLTFLSLYLAKPVYADDDSKAFNVFDKIMQLKSEGVNDVQRELMTRQAASTLVYNFADEIGNKDGKATPDETRKALAYLMDSKGAFGKIADKYAGNNNGTVTQDELNALGGKRSQYPGMVEIISMWQQYGKPKVD